MALPSEYPKAGGTPIRYGIVLALAPDITQTGWELCDVMIQEAPDSAGSPNAGSAADVFRRGPLPQRGDRVTLLYPNDGVRRHFRWRHVRDGFDDGAQSDWLRTPPSTGTYGAKPAPLPVDVPAVPQVVGSVLFNSSAPPAPKSPAGAGVVTRTLRIGFGELLSVNNSNAYAITSGYLSSTTGASNLFYASVVIPNGATITDVSMRAYKAAAPDVVTGTLRRLGDSGSWTDVAQMIFSAGTGWFTATDTAAETVSDDAYVLEVDINAASEGRFVWFDVTYTIPDLGKGY